MQATNEEEASSEEDEQDEERDAAAPPGSEDEDPADHMEEGDNMPHGLDHVGRKKLSLSLKKKGSKGAVCHVCGRAGHAAGFLGGGSIYMDCPFKPCYLCKEPGHTTQTCPHRIAPEHGCTKASRASQGNFLNKMRQRQTSGRKYDLNLPTRQWQVDAGVLRLMTRRVTCLEFHPSRDDVVLAGDKKGVVALWDFQKVHERLVIRPHHAHVSNIKYMPDREQCCSSSADGHLKLWDVETSTTTSLENVNPNGYINSKLWQQFLGLAISAAGCVLAGDTLGRLHFVDARTPGSFAKPQIHKKEKINSVHTHPMDRNLVLTASNDHTAQISDIRRLSTSVASSSGSSAGGEEEPTLVASMAHPKVVNSAYFSPLSGSKVLTTCIDNRLRVWDSIWNCQEPPSRAIVHSHDFNRYLTPFRAEWDPKDPSERLVVVGRYISEDFGGRPLHPVDLMDASTGRLISELIDPNLVHICPVNKPHPRQDVIVTGASRSLYAWRPKPADEEEEEARTAAAEQRRSVGASAAAGGSNGADQGTTLLGGTGNFLCFDVEESASDQKKKAKRKPSIATKQQKPAKKEK